MAMATHPPQLRQLLDPQSQSVQKNPSARHPTPRKTACQGCHARKKRCITAPTQYRCANCSREGRNCVPRKTSARYVQPASRLTQAVSVSNTNRSIPCTGQRGNKEIDRLLMRSIFPCRMGLTMKFHAGVQCTRCFRR